MLFVAKDREVTEFNQTHQKLQILVDVAFCNFYQALLFLYLFSLACPGLLDHQIPDFSMN